MPNVLDAMPVPSSPTEEEEESSKPPNGSARDREKEEALQRLAQITAGAAPAPVPAPVPVPQGQPNGGVRAVMIQTEEERAKEAIQERKIGRGADRSWLLKD